MSNFLKKRFYRYFLGIFLIFSLTQITFAANDPIALLQSIANNMIAGLKTHQANLKTKPQVVYDLAYRYVVPYASLEEMSRRVIPPQTWEHATPAQRAQFKKEFTRLLIRTYASGLTSYQGQVIQFYPIRGGSSGLKTVVVDSEIKSPSTQPLRVSYRLLNIGNQWRLYDMSVEGVDMLESFRSQFADILSKGDMNLLLSRLAAHNKGRR